MARMKAIQATRPGSDWELVERDIPQPKAGQVRVKVQACGVCHSTAVNPGEQRQRLGGARVTLATAPDSKAIASMVDGLGANGTLLIVAAPGEPVMVNAITLIGKRASVQGWPSGTSKDSEDTLRFSAMTGVRPMDDRTVSPRPRGGGLSADDERQGEVPRGPDHEPVTWKGNLEARRCSE